MTPVEDRFKGLWGQRRFFAAKMVGLDSVPAVICARQLTEAAAHELTLIENLARVELRPLEEAMGIARYMKTSGLAASEVAKRVGLNPAAVSKSLALLSLPDWLREQINLGAISAAAGYELSRIDNPQLQSELAGEVAAGRLSRDGVAGRVKAAKRAKADTSEARSRVTIALDAHRSVTLAGDGLSSLETLIDWLEELLTKARKARPQNLELGTFTKMLKDQARA